MKTIKILGILMLMLSVFAIGALAEENQTNETDTEDNSTVDDSPDYNLTETNETETNETETNETETEEEEEEEIEVDEETVEEAGTTPDQTIRWGLERAMERIDLALTFNKSAKAQKGLAHARERLAEVQMMIAEKKFDKAEKSQVAHGKALEKVKKAVEDMEDGEGSLEAELEIEQELGEQEKKISKVKMNIKGRFSAEEQEQLNALIASFENSTAEIKMKVNEKKEETKVRIKAKEGKSSEEVEKIEAKIKAKVKAEEKDEDNIEKIKSETKAKNKKG